MLIDERTVRRIGLPRRHVASFGDRRDERRAALHVVVGEQVERPRSARVMAHRAAIGDQRRDVFRVRDRFGRGDVASPGNTRVKVQARRHEARKCSRRRICVSKLSSWLPCCFVSSREVGDETAHGLRGWSRNRFAGQHRGQRIGQIVRRRRRPLEPEIHVAIVDAAEVGDATARNHGGFRGDGRLDVLTRASAGSRSASNEPS